MLINSLIHKLNEPFPDNASFKKATLKNLGIATFVCLFLYLFKPFSLHQVEENLFRICLAYGAVTLFVCQVYEIFCRYVLKLKTDISSWTFWKWALASLCLVILIAIGNYYLSHRLYPEYINSWSTFFTMVGNTFAIGAITIPFSGLIIQLRAVERNQKQANKINNLPHKPIAEDRKISLSISKTENLDLPLSSILYIEAMQNYVSVAYKENNKIQNQIIRSTLSRLATQMENSSILRTHRSYLVNTSYIQEIKGNAQGLRLFLKKYANAEEIEIPVSRSYIPAFRDAFEQISPK